MPLKQITRHNTLGRCASDSTGENEDTRAQKNKKKAKREEKSAKQKTSVAPTNIKKKRGIGAGREREREESHVYPYKPQIRVCAMLIYMPFCRRATRARGEILRMIFYVEAIFPPLYSERKTLLYSRSTIDAGKTAAAEAKKEKLFSIFESAR